MQRLIVLLLALIGAPVALAGPLVEVFTDAAHPVAGAAALAAEGVQVELYDLDAPARFEAELGRNLPADPEAAMRIAHSRIAALDPAALARHLEQDYRGALRAMALGLDRYPAVVFDGRAVIYGVTDLRRALALYRTWEDKR